MSAIRNHPVIRDLMFAGLCLGGSYLLGKKNQKSSSLMLTTGTSLVVCLSTQDKHPGIRICGPVLAALATTFLTRRPFMKKRFARLKGVEALALSAGVGVAHALTEHLFRSNAKVAEECFAKGENLGLNGHWEEAKEVLQRAVKAYKDGGITGERLGYAQCLLGTGLLKQGKKDEADVLLAAAIETYKAADVKGLMLGDAQYARGYVLYALGRKAETIAAFREVIETYKAAGVEGETLKNAQDTLRDHYYTQKMWVEFIEAYKAEGIVDEYLVHAQYNLGETLIEEEKWEDAEKVLRGAIQVSRDVGPLCVLSLSMKKLIEVLPRRYAGEELGDALCVLGEDLLGLKKISDEAKAAFTRAGETYQDVGIEGEKLGRAQLGLGHTLIRLQDSGAAQAVLEGAVKNAQGERLGEAQYYLAGALHCQEKLDDSKGMLEEAITTYTTIGNYGRNYFNAQVALGVALAGVKEWAAAEDHCRRLLQDERFDGSKMHIQQALGDALSGQKKWGGAIRAYGAAGLKDDNEKLVKALAEDRKERKARGGRFALNRTPSGAFEV